MRMHAAEIGYIALLCAVSLVMGPGSVSQLEQRIVGGGLCDGNGKVTDANCPGWDCGGTSVSNYVGSTYNTTTDNESCRVDDADCDNIYDSKVTNTVGCGG